MKYKFILKKIIALFPLSWMEKILVCKFGYNLLSYSQYGEDIVLRNLFSKKQTGFFVDVGAHHPTQFSNTYWFYRRGWAGINIDARPGSMGVFKKMRPRDINIEMAISDSPKMLSLNVFNKLCLSTFSTDLADEHVHQGYSIQRRVILETKTLKEILDENIPLGQEIDFLTIDVESYDLAVLNSNDWVKHTPKIIVVEDREYLNPKSKIVSFLKDKNYLPIASMTKTIIFKKI